MLGSNNLMMKKKTIWFINKDAAPIEFYGTHLRTIKLAQYFQSEGYNVKLFCSSYVHNRNLCLSDSNKTFEEKTYDNIPFVLVNAGCGSTNGIRRIISYFRFAVKLFIHRKQFEKPDVIIHTSRIPFDIPIYQLAKKVKAKYIVDVTDLWPDSFVSLGLLGKNNPCVKIAYCLERYIYSKADNVVFSMPGAVNYVRENGWDSDQGGTIDLNKLHYINNGIDLSEFNVNMQRYKIEDFDLATCPLSMQELLVPAVVSCGEAGAELYIALQQNIQPIFVLADGEAIEAIPQRWQRDWVIVCYRGNYLFMKTENCKMEE